ncbi:MAG: hypothetical protein IJ837_01405 [Clostridia bacterium]|nr:hypothetical protein [Clostridia bacterium]
MKIKKYNNLKFKIHPLFVLFLFVFVFQGLFDVLVAYLLVLLLHEYAHFLVANKMGYHLNTFNLMPHGISLSGKNILFSYKDEIIIALAGPFVNIILAIFGFALWWIFPESYIYTKLFVFANLFTGLINFLPVFPMDGGRVMLAILSKKHPRNKALKITTYAGIITSFLLILGFVVSTFFSVNFTLLTLGVFCFFTASFQDKTSVYERSNFLDNKNLSLNQGLIIRELAVSENTTLYKIVSQIRQDSITNFRVIDKNLKTLGIIEEKQINKLIQIYPATTTLKTILT